MVSYYSVNMSDYFETQFKADLYSKFESVEMWRNSSRKDLHQTPLYYVPIEDMFDVIKHAHISTGHGGRDRMLKHLSLKYANITRDIMIKHELNCINFTFHD